MQIYLEGKIRSRTWDDKEGNKRYTTEIVGDSFTILGKKEENQSRDSGQGQREETQENNAPNISNSSTDDLPF